MRYAGCGSLIPHMNQAPWWPRTQGNNCTRSFGYGTTPARCSYLGSLNDRTTAFECDSVTDTLATVCSQFPTGEGLHGHLIYTMFL